MEAISQPRTEDVRPGEALSIARRFTTAGVHPFDTVEWERRDARIGHGGHVAFEQLDLEFPRTWSQNATNIVAQKYFRGQMSSPLRERSVKQMIGRVSGTIADWGRARGYFATPESADAFEDELTFILLHQYAAFNSPVWFNVGFEENPQCSACQPGHALVSTPQGMIPIGALVEGDLVGQEVFDASGVTRIVATKANGRRPVLRARLRNGSFVEATPDHVVRAVTERRTSPAWVRMDELEVGMRMHLHPHRAKVSDPIRVGVGADGDEAVPAGLEEVDPVAVAEAALAGWLQADGFVGRVHGHQSLTDRRVRGRERRRVRLGHATTWTSPSRTRIARCATPRRSTWASGGSASTGRCSGSSSRRGACSRAGPRSACPSACSRRRSPWSPRICGASSRPTGT